MKSHKVFFFFFFHKIFFASNQSIVKKQKLPNWVFLFSAVILIINKVDFLFIIIIIYLFDNICS